MDIIETYNRLAKSEALPKMDRGGYEVLSETLRDPGGVWARLKELAPVQGWLLFQSHQTAFRSGLPEAQPEWGVLLACEAADTHGNSIALGQDGAGGWRVTLYRHAAGGDMLFDKPALIASDPACGHLRYRRYWRREADGGYVQAVACFVGFD